MIRMAIKTVIKLLNDLFLMGVLSWCNEAMMINYAINGMSNFMLYLIKETSPLAIFPLSFSTIHPKTEFALWKGQKDGFESKMSLDLK